MTTASIFDLPIDLDQAARFVRALAGSRDAVVTFQTYDDDERRKAARGRHERDPLAAIRHGTLAQHARWLERMNHQGAGIYVTVNATDGQGRKASNVVALRAVFVDDDAGQVGDPWDLPLLPSFCARARRGPHIYWLLAEGEPLDGFREAQKALAMNLHTDTQIVDLPRVMRLPGFWHLKDPAHPYLVTYGPGNRRRRYTLAEVLAAFPLPAGGPARASSARSTPAPVNFLDVTERARRYGAAALADEAREVRETGKGGRNRRLNIAAVKVGRLAAACGITESSAFEELVNAAVEAGLGAQESATTFRSGWRKGASQPKGLPPSDDRPSGSMQ